VDGVLGSTYRALRRKSTLFVYINPLVMKKTIINIAFVLVSINFVQSQVIHLEIYKSEFMQISYLDDSDDTESINYNLEKPAYLFHNTSDSELKITSSIMNDNFKTEFVRYIDETETVSKTEVYKAFSESKSEYYLGITNTKNGESFTKHIHTSHRFMLIIGDISIIYYCNPAN